MSDARAERLAREAAFHDDWAAGIDPAQVPVVAAFEGSTAPENRFILRHLGDVRGLRLLDLGCGAGENSVYFAGRGAQCVAADYSPGMVEAALALAGAHGVAGAVDGRVIDAHAIDFPDDTFDVVYAANLLHHVETEQALREMHRVLKPGGRACVWDPLRHNPVINVYRRLATAVRTEDEHPLDIGIVDFVQRLYRDVQWDTFWLASLWIFLRFYLVERVDPNAERYWKKILTEEPRLRARYLRLERVDEWIKSAMPELRRYAWNIALVATK